MNEEEHAKQMLQWALQPDPTMEPSDAHSSNGEIPGYTIEKILGQGGMGAVYKARHRELGRVVAIKIFSSTSEDADLFIERLRKEGRMMAQLEHPNVLGIHDAAITADGVPYLILEYIDGMDLFTRLQNAETLSEREAIRIATSVCHGLSAVHQLGIIHRDIKPANILLGNDGSIKVSDFGISKDVEDTDGTQLTLTGTTVGTVDYMSPEHSAGLELDSRADIYSVGVMLYEMIAGVTPRGAFEPLSKYGASKPMEKLVMKCLQRDKENRVNSAEDLISELNKVKASLLKTAPPAWQQTLIGVAAGIGVVALLFAILPESSTPHDAPKNNESQTPPHTTNIWDAAHWNDMKDITETFIPNSGVSKEGASLVSEPYGIQHAFSKIKPSQNYVLELRWKRYTGKNSIGVFLPTPYGNTVFEMGAWDKELLGLQAYQKDGQQITMKQLGSSGNFQPNKPLHYPLKNGVYHHVRIHVRDSKMAILFKEATATTYKKCGFYDLSNKKWNIPSAWQVPHFTTIGVGSYKSQMYVSEIKYKSLD